MTENLSDAQQRDEIISLNVAFADRERCPTAEGSAWFEARLVDDFIFRRRDKSVLGREEFIQGLLDPENQNDYLDAAVLDVKLAGDLAGATVSVALRGRRGGSPVDGVFLNRRLFRRHRQHGWQCVTWWNEPVEGRTSSQGPVDEATPVLARTTG